MLVGCGRVSFDPLCVAHDAVIIDRGDQWQAGATPGSTLGNPTSEVDGIAWSYEWISGDALGTASPWYRQPGTQLVWDDDWFGQGGMWTYSDDLLPLVGRDEMTQEFDWVHIGVIRLLNVADTAMQVRCLGTITLRWRGYEGTTPAALPIDVDVAIIALGAESEQAILASTLAKPTADASHEDLVIPVPDRPVVIDPGDSLVITIRPTQSNPPANAWTSVDDNGLQIELAQCQ